MIESADPLPFSPAAERNQGPILERLRAWLPADAQVLEIASGTGQHAAHFATAGPGWAWQPTDAETDALAWIAARCAPWPQVRRPVLLDVRRLPWTLPDASGDSIDDAPGTPPAAPQSAYDAVFVANLLHISPWPCTAALMAGAAQVLRPGGQLVVYGPFIVPGVPTAPSNLAFDADLRQRDPAWGLRELPAVQACAQAQGLQWVESVEMPANNRLLRWRRADPAR